MSAGETTRAMARLAATRRARRPAGDPIRALVALVVISACVVAWHLVRATG